MSTVRVSYTITNKTTQEEIDVFVDCDWDKIIPARLNCDPDDSSPEEGGYQGITKVTNSLTGEEIPIASGLECR